ncbi:MAG: FtsL-like putative cell division protein [Bacteroidales bacterium]
MYQENRHIDFEEMGKDTGNLSGRSGVTDREMETPGPKTAKQEPGKSKKAAAEPSKSGNKVRIKELIDGTFLVRENVLKQLPYLLFLTFLGVIYIGNRFHAERMVRQISDLKIEVGNLRSEQITITSELMNISRPSEVAALVESKGLGLKESMDPPKKIKR